MDSPQYLEIAIKGDAEIAKLQKNDIVIVRVDRALTPELHERIKDAFAKSPMAGIKYLIVDDTFNFSILRPVPVNGGSVEEEDGGSD